MIIFACGLSKSGKTSLIRNARLEQFGIQHVVASELLKSLGRSTTLLTRRDVVANQKILVQGLLALMSHCNSTILLDGHLLIETEATIEIIPVEELDALPLLGVIQIHEMPSTIFARRVKTPVAKPASEFNRLFKLEAGQASKLASRHDVKRYQLESRDSVRLTEIVIELKRARSASARH
jgi:adenylate kinase